MNLGIPDFLHPPGRVVSLVPSMTKSMFDLGLGSALVGATDYCVLPAGSSIQRVGGPKDASVGLIQLLQPNLVLANREENTRELVLQLERAGMAVWVAFPKTVRQSMDDLWTLARVFHSKNAVLRLRLLEDNLQMAELGLAEQARKRYFCPIWQGEHPDGTLWWMTFNQDSYPADVLRICGGENVFAGRSRKYPLPANWGGLPVEETGERDTRYPVVTVQDIVAAQPDMILLPDEPYRYQNEHVEQFKTLFSDTPAIKNNQIIMLDGSLITWHGTRLGKALATLPALLL